MNVIYKTKSLKKICTNASEARKKYGKNISDKIHQRIGEIRAADTVNNLVLWHIGRCHALTGNRQGQYAMDVSPNYRLIFKIIDDEIQIAEIMEISDYHG